MADAADIAAAPGEAAMARFEEEQRQRRIAESMRPFDHNLPVNCVDCGEIVPSDRLKAYPRTRRCQPCASDVERRWAS